MTESAPWILRPIRPADNVEIAAVIREVMTEYGCCGAGFAIHDAEVEDMSSNYAAADAGFFVVERSGEVLGGGGYARLAGTTDAESICELRKMYFRQAARGHGLGHALLDLLLEEMRTAGYRECYLETTTGMETAQHVYRQHGFGEIAAPRGATGHHGCDKFFAREL